MRGKMCTHETERGIIELKADGCSSLVPHHTHDTNSDTGSVNMLHAGFVRGFDEYAD
jgi:hypothetical protein